MQTKKFFYCGIAVLAIFVFFGPVLNLFAPMPCALRFSSQASKLPPQSIFARAGKLNAVPTFARKFNASCTTCHSAPPYLNETGRQFKERGFLMPDEKGQIEHKMQRHQEISSQLILEKYFPISLRIKSFPFDIKQDKKAKFRPLHEAELLALGNTFDFGSFMVELEIEDDENFEPHFHGRFAVHPSKYFNIAAGYASVLSTDPYNSLALGGHRLTIGKKTLLQAGYKSGISLAQSAQFVNLYGRAGAFYYTAGLAATPGQLKDLEPKFGQGRLALDLLEELAIGIFAFGGSAEFQDEDSDVAHTQISNSRKLFDTDHEEELIGDSDSSKTISLWRAGMDFNFSSKDFNVLAMFSLAGDKETGKEAQINYGGSTEFFYIWRSEGTPKWLPVVRLDGITSKDADDFTLSLFGGLSHYLRENFRLGVEGSVELAKPEEKDRNWRTTVFADFIF